MRERDGGIERQQRSAGETERRDGERDAVRERERGDGLHQHPSIGDDEQQTEHEEQMIDAEQDVLDAEPNVVERPLRDGRHATQADRRAGRTQQVALKTAVGVLRTHEHIGDRRFEPGDRDRLAADPVRTVRACPARRRRPAKSAPGPELRDDIPSGPPARSGSRPRRRPASSTGTSTLRDWSRRAPGSRGEPRAPSRRRSPAPRRVPSSKSAAHFASLASDAGASPGISTVIAYFASNRS